MTRQAWNRTTVDGLEQTIVVHLPPEGGMVPISLEGLTELLLEAGYALQEEVTHAAPGPGHSITSCCGRTPFELPPTDRMTSEPERVTCTGAN